MSDYLSAFTNKKKQTALIASLVKSHLPTDSLQYEFSPLPTIYDRLSSCGSFLQFAVPSAGPARLYRANFCRDRICPMCNWRRSRSVFSQLSKILDYLGDSYSYYFLTLTIVSRHGDKLSDQVSLILKAWDKLLKRREVKRLVRGYYRALETTYNRSQDWFHPHLHVCLAFDNSDSAPISKDTFLQYWRDACNDPDISQVDLRASYAKGSSDVASVKTALESCKYACKFDDLFFPSEPDLSIRVLLEFRAALSGRRLISFGKAFSKARSYLRLSDPEVVLEDDCSELVSFVVKSFHWAVGAYVCVSEEEVL